MASSKSIVWRFCTIKEDDKSKVLCNICKESISRGGKTSVTYNTTNIKKHLYMKHKKEVENEEKLMNEEIEKTKKKRKIGQSGDDGAEAGTSRTNIQLTMEQTFELKTKWAIDSQDAKSLHKYIGEMIAIDNQPYSIVEDEGFQRFVGKACPKYEIPSRKYFSQTVVPDIYKKVRNKLQIIVDGCESISFTSDIWTASASNTAFISLTGHCLSKTFEQQVGVLRVAHFPESHTGSNISEIILNCIEEFNIPIYKVHLIVRDNGPNMVKGINDSGISSLSCVLHTMQLIIKDSIFNQKIVKDTIAICRSIVTHFNHSPQASAKLKELQQKLGSPEKKLVQDVPTRWNSTFLMFQRMLEQKAPVGTYCLDVQGLPNLDSNKWNVIAKLVEILGIFYETTVRLSDRTCTAADIIPNIRYIKMFLDKAEKKVNAGSSLAGLGSTIISLKGSTDKRFERYMKDTNVILATFLDPRYKNNLFEDEEHQMTCKENLVSIMAKTIETLQRDEESETGSASEKSSEPGDAELETFDFDKCFNEIVKKSVSGDKHERPSESSEPTPDKESVAKRIPSPKKAKLIDAVNSEVDRYLAMKRIERKENPLEWWNSNKLLFKYLTFLAKKFLSPPPSSVESERLFSTGGQIYSPRRNRLNPETGEQLMFLNFNLKIFNFEY